jgi:putative membrane protein
LLVTVGFWILDFGFEIQNTMKGLCCWLGIVLLALLWLGPLPRLAQQSFAAHMLMHMGVVAIAAPVLAIGIGGARFDPVRQIPRLFSPIPASVLELVVVWAWHAPALHHAARHRGAVLVIEQGMFLLSGLLVWMAAFGGERSGSNRSAVGIVALLLTATHMTLLGALLALTPRPLYAHSQGLASLSALDDQHLGGAIMLLIGGASYLAGGLGLTLRLLRKPLLAPAEQGRV